MFIFIIEFLSILRTNPVSCWYIKISLIAFVYLMEGLDPSPGICFVFSHLCPRFSCPSVGLTMYPSMCQDTDVAVIGDCDSRQLVRMSPERELQLLCKLKYYYIFVNKSVMSFSIFNYFFLISQGGHVHSLGN